MAFSSSGRCGKLQQAQINGEVKKIIAYIRNNAVGMDKYEFLQMHEALGIEPLEEDIPPTLEDFLQDTLIVFDIYYLLKDDWDTFNGNYLGKQLDTLPMIYNMFEIGKEKQILYLSLLNIIIYENITIMSDKAKNKELADKEIASLKKKSSGSE